MFDDPPVRHRADQPGEEFPDVRRMHDWSDVEGKPWLDAPEPPQPVQEPPRRALRVLPDPEPSEPLPEALPAEPAINQAAGLRGFLKLLARHAEARLQEERPPWDR